MRKEKYPEPEGDSDPYLLVVTKLLTDADPGGPKIYGSCGSGTLI
jgi:hypothetical protein